MGHFERTSTKRNGRLRHAGIAQLVEHDLAKVGVASSNLVSRSNILEHTQVAEAAGATQRVASWNASPVKSRYPLQILNSTPGLLFKMTGIRREKFRVMGSTYNSTITNRNSL